MRNVSARLSIYLSAKTNLRHAAALALMDVET
jgi:hypothetical protein